MPELATVPDLLRLVVLPYFGYVAWRDIKTRRVPNRTWYPLAALAIVLLVWEVYAVQTGDLRAFERNRFYVQVGISILFLVPLSYGFWLVGGFGGADAKAFMVLALLLPTYPTYKLWVLGVEGTLATVPVVQSNVGVFSMTVLSNTVLVGALYPVALAARNALSGYASPAMFVATPIQTTAATQRYGTLLEFSDRRLRDDLSLSGLRSYFSWRRLDLDALRMYLQWRGVSLATLCENPDRHRDPASLPDDPNPPGDGSIPEGGWTVTEGSTVGTDGGEVDDGPGADAPQAAYEDPWGAEAFLDEIEGSAYGTRPETLREGLDTLTGEDVVWISPGIPFLVPLFVGLLIAFSYGDLLFSGLTAVGLV